MTLFEDGCPDEAHSWSEATRAEVSQGELIGQTCGICGLVWVRLVRTDGSTLGLAG